MLAHVTYDDITKKFAINKFENFVLKRVQEIQLENRKMREDSKIIAACQYGITMCNRDKER